MASRASLRARELYNVLHYKWNGLHRKKRFKMTDQEIMVCMGTTSKSVVSAAKKELIELGVIRCESSKKRFGCSYEMVSLE